MHYFELQRFWFTKYAPKLAAWHIQIGNLFLQMTNMNLEQLSGHGVESLRHPREITFNTNNHRHVSQSGNDNNIQLSQHRIRRQSTCCKFLPHVVSCLHNFKCGTQRNNCFVWNGVEFNTKNNNRSIVIHFFHLVGSLSEMMSLEKIADNDFLFSVFWNTAFRKGKPKQFFVLHTPKFRICWLCVKTLGEWPSHGLET
jgi:hypothetical protein